MHDVKIINLWCFAMSEQFITVEARTVLAAGQEMFFTCAVLINKILKANGWFNEIQNTIFHFIYFYCLIYMFIQLNTPPIMKLKE